MKQAVFTIVISMAVLLNAIGQDDKDLVVSVGRGLLNSPTYENASAKGVFRIDFDYHLTDRHILNASYLSGNHFYHDEVLSNDPTGRTYKNGTNAIADYRTFSVMYKYRLIDNSHFSIATGAGVEVITHSRDYP